jgi:hypothetical protein
MAAAALAGLREDLKLQGSQFQVRPQHEAGCPQRRISNPKFTKLDSSEHIICRLCPHAGSVKHAAQQVGLPSHLSPLLRKCPRIYFMLNS